MARMSQCLEALGDTYPVILGICMSVVVVPAVIGLRSRMFLLVTSQRPSRASLEVIPAPYYAFSSILTLSNSTSLSVMDGFSDDKAGAGLKASLFGMSLLALF